MRWRHVFVSHPAVRGAWLRCEGAGVVVSVLKAEAAARGYRVVEVSRAPEDSRFWVPARGDD